MAVPGQDHLGHIFIHLSFLEHPLLGASPLIGEDFTAAGLQHIAEHMCMLYAESTFQAVGIPMPQGQPLPPEADQQVTRALAQVTPQVLAGMGQRLGTAPDTIMAALERLKAYQQLRQDITPIQTQDPLAKATIDAGLAETARKARKDAVDARQGDRKLDIEAEKAGIDEDRLAIDRTRDVLDIAGRATRPEMLIEALRGM